MISEIFTWVAKHFGKDLVNKTAKLILDKKQTAHFKEAGEKYQNEMELRYGKIKIYGLSEPLKLNDIYTLVNVLNPSGLNRNYSISRLEGMYLGKRGFGDLAERDKNAFEMVKEKDKLFILGKPGAGKTTFLKNITFKAVHGQLNLIPVFISLRNYSETNCPMIEYICLQFDICNFPNAEKFVVTMLENGKSIILFDGLDEINDTEDSRNKTIQEIVDFTDKYNKNKIVVTCRVAALDYEFEHFTYVEIADFKEKQINIFVNKWFEGNKREAKLFFSEFQKNEHLKDLSRNPLLLTLLCIAFSDRWTFSKNSRSEVYEIAIDALIKKWDSTRKITRDVGKKITLRQARQLFQEIAEKSFKKEQYFFKKKEISNEFVDFFKKLPDFEHIDVLEGEELLHDIIEWTGIFSIRTVDLYAFSHLTFQEYFTAEFIVNATDTEDRLKKIISNHLYDTRWKEIFLLLSEMLPDTESFFQLFIDQITMAYIEVSDLEELLIETEAITKPKENGQSSDLKTIGHKWMFFSTMVSGIAFYNDALNRFSQPKLHRELRKRLYVLNQSIISFIGKEEISETVNMESEEILFALRIQFLAWVYNCVSDNKPLPYPSILAFELVKNTNSIQDVRRLLYKIESYRLKKQAFHYVDATRLRLIRKIGHWLQDNCEFNLISKPINQSFIDFIYSTDLCLLCLGSAALKNRSQYVNKLLRPLI